MVILLISLPSSRSIKIKQSQQRIQANMGVIYHIEKKNRLSLLAEAQSPILAPL